MYVTNNGDGTVSVINPTSNTVVGSPINVASSPGHPGVTYMPDSIAYNPDNHNMYVTRGDNTVIVINPTSNTVLAGPITVRDGPTGITYNPYSPMYLQLFN